MARHVTSGAIGVDLTATPTTPEFELGTLMNSTDGVCWMYVHASGAITQYDCVGIDEDFEAASMTHAIAADGWAVGFAQSAFADNDYGWVAMSGSNIQCNLLISCAADVPLFTSATAGNLDDASVASALRIEGLVSVATITAATNAEVIATSPRSITF
jgi:hypothetical protein